MGQSRSDVHKLLYWTPRESRGVILATCFRISYISAKAWFFGVSPTRWYGICGKLRKYSMPWAFVGL